MDPQPVVVETVPPTPDINTTTDAITAVTQKVWGWAEGFVLMLPNLLIALVVITLAWFIARVMASLADRAGHRFVANQELSRLIAILVRTAVLLVGLFLALSVLELDKTVTSLLAGVGVIGIALGFAFQDIAANFMSGVLLVSRRPFNQGDWVELNGRQGTVIGMDLRSVTIQGTGGEYIQLPNKDVFQNPMVNYFRSGVRMIEIKVGVGYDADLEEVVELARKAMEPHNLVESKSAAVFVTGFGDSAIDLSVRFWIPAKDERGLLARKTDAMMALKRALDTAGVDIPFPIRTLNGGAPIRFSRDADGKPKGPVDRPQDEGGPIDSK